MDGNERRALDAIGATMGIPHFSMDRAVTRQQDALLGKACSYLAGLHLDRNTIWCGLDSTPTPEAAQNSAEIHDQLFACATLRDFALFLKPRIAELHALLQTIEPKEEV